MDYRKVTAVVRHDVLKKVERKLVELGVQGISVTLVRGFGDYADCFSSDWTASHARIEIFTSAEEADPIAQSVMEAAHVGLEGDGTVAIVPVEKLYQIRTRSEVSKGSE